MSTYLIVYQKKKTCLHFEDLLMIEEKIYLKLVCIVLIHTCCGLDYFVSMNVI